MGIFKRARRRIRRRFKRMRRRIYNAVVAPVVAPVVADAVDDAIADIEAATEVSDDNQDEGPVEDIGGEGGVVGQSGTGTTGHWLQGRRDNLTLGDFLFTKRGSRSKHSQLRQR